MVASSNKKLSSPTELIIEERNILICKTILNISHCLYHILDVRSWFTILETMQKIELIIKHKLHAGGHQLEKKPSFNQKGNQTLLNFNDLKDSVSGKMHQFNIHERKSSQFTQLHTRLSLGGS